MQDVVAGNLRGAVPRNQCERIERDRRSADVADVVLDGEEVAVVDRNGALEGQAVAIVVFQRHRGGGREAVGAFLLPHGRLVGNSHRRAGGGDPAEFGVIGALGSRRRIQHDRGRGRIDGLAELDQRQVVDTRALQRNAADQARGIDLDAGRGGDGGFAADHGRGGGGLCRRVGRWRAAGLRCGRGRRAGSCLGSDLGHLALGLLRGALLLHLRHVVEILPGDQHQAGQNDGEDGVAIIVDHSRSRHSMRFAAGAGAIMS